MNIKIARIKKGLRQKELCEMVGITPRRMGEFEKGNYNSLKFPEMKKLAKALDSTIEELFLSDD